MARNCNQIFPTFIKHVELLSNVVMKPIIVDLGKAMPNGPIKHALKELYHIPSKHLCLAQLDAKVYHLLILDLNDHGVLILI